MVKHNALFKALHHVIIENHSRLASLQAGLKVKENSKLLAWETQKRISSTDIAPERHPDNFISIQDIILDAKYFGKKTVNNQ